MERIRLGNNIAISWALYDLNGRIHSLEDKEVQLYVSCGGLKQAVTDYTIQGNVVSWVFLGTEQKKVGLYKLILVETDALSGAQVVDVAEAFRLVSETLSAVETGEVTKNVSVRSVLTYSNLVGVESVDVVESSEDDGINLVSIRLVDGNVVEIPIKNGSKGDTGATGATGATGPKGDKGDIGERGPAGIDSVEAEIGTNDPTQAPSVDKDLTEGVLSLTFNNIKGAKGDQGEPAVAVDKFVTVEATSSTTSATDVLPATGSADTVYRVSNWDGTQYDDTAYTEYGWYNGAYKQLATRTPGIDDEPTANSSNLVKSGGVASQISQLGQQVTYLQTDVVGGDSHSIALTGNVNHMWNFKLTPGRKYIITPTPNDWTIATLPAGTAYFVINKVNGGETSNIVIVRVGSDVDSSYEITAEQNDYYYVNLRGDAGQTVTIGLSLVDEKAQEINELDGRVSVLEDVVESKSHTWTLAGSVTQAWNVELIPGKTYRIIPTPHIWGIASIPTGYAYFVINKISNGVTTNVVVVRTGENVAEYYDILAEAADYYQINVMGDSGQSVTIRVDYKDGIGEDVEKLNSSVFDLDLAVFGISHTWTLNGDVTQLWQFNLKAGKKYRITPLPCAWNISSIPANKAYFVINKVWGGSTTNVVVIRTGQQVSPYYEITAEDSDYYYINMLGDAGQTVKVLIQEEVQKLPKTNGKKFVCFGDSITSDDISGIGTKVNALLGTINVGNFAVGGASCANWSYEGANYSTESVAEYHNEIREENVLMNQVLRLIQYVTEFGQQISWTHPLDGSFSVPTSVGTGLGHTSEVPDIIYIAIGINDGQIDSRQGDPWATEGISPTPLVDDFETVRGQSYSQLTKTTMASALRWALETLQSKFPNAQIFVASPLHTGYKTNETMGSFADYYTWTKAQIIRKVADLCSVNYVPSFEKSGYGQLRGKQYGLHPTGVWETTYIPKFVAKEIEEQYIQR